MTEQSPPVSAELPTQGIEVDALFLANSAETRDSLVYVLGGGWTRCWPGTNQTYPFQRQIALIVLIRVPYHESNREHEFSVSVRDSEESEIALGGPATGNFKVGRDVSLTPGMSQLIALSMGASINLEAPGIYQVVVSIGGRESKKIQFEALPAAPN